MTIVTASKEQIKKIFRKHLFRVFAITYAYDSDDCIGFVSCYNIFGCLIQFQWRNGIPMFFELQKRDVRYDIIDLEGEMLKRVTKIGKIAEKRFWKGGQL